MRLASSSRGRASLSREAPQSGGQVVYEPLEGRFGATGPVQVHCLHVVHDDVGVSAADVHEATRLLHTALPRYIEAYPDWQRAGFSPAR
jgi:hypothetical protein